MDHIPFPDGNDHDIDHAIRIHNAAVSSVGIRLASHPNHRLFHREAIWKDAHCHSLLRPSHPDADIIYLRQAASIRSFLVGVLQRLLRIHNDPAFSHHKNGIVAGHVFVCLYAENMRQSIHQGKAVEYFFPLM